MTFGMHNVIYMKFIKAGLNLCGFVMLAILSDSEFHSFIVQGKNEYL